MRLGLEADALLRMQAENARAGAWRAALKVGDEQLDQGEGVVYNLAELESMTESAASAMHSGPSMDADVLP